MRYALAGCVQLGVFRFDYTPVLGFRVGTGSRTSLNIACEKGNVARPNATYRKWIVRSVNELGLDAAVSGAAWGRSAQLGLVGLQADRRAPVMFSNEEARWPPSSSDRTRRRHG